MRSVHVVPLCDLVLHDVPGALDETPYDGGWLTIEVFASDLPAEECVCRPSLELSRTPSGADGWIVVHHSLDGREVAMPPPAVS